MIAEQTALDIAFVYREIRVAKKLLEQIEESMKDRQQLPDIRDAFGRRQELQLGVPSGDTGQRLFGLPWTLARPVIKAHIAEQEAKLTVLNDIAFAQSGQR